MKLNMLYLIQCSWCCFNIDTIVNEAFNKIILLFCMYVFPACMYVHHIHAWYLLRSEEDIRYPETVVTDGYESLCGCWELNP